MKLRFDKPLKIKERKYVMNSYIQENDLKKFWKIWHEKKMEIKKMGFH
jgi:acyl CoA:acetate/3-ketoacid CoA transferase alpha subunit